MEERLRRLPGARSWAGLHNNAGTHTTVYRLSKYIVVGSTALSCRECGAPTIPTCGNRCAECWRWELTERRLERITRMTGGGR
ncbi:MAG: hypothetical protein ACREV4_12930 [Gammaproteobacteria bacterium]